MGTSRQCLILSLNDREIERQRGDRWQNGGVPRWIAKMPQVTLSYANLTNGRATATFIQSFTQSDGKVVLADEAYAQVTFTAGVATFTNLPGTRSIGVGCRFTIEKGTSTFTKVTEFVATIPDGTTPVTGADLFQGFVGARDSLDLTLAATADLLTIEPFITRLSQRIPGFEYKPWAAATVFSKNQFTARGAKLFRYEWSAPLAGIDPIDVSKVTTPPAAATAAAPWVLVLEAPAGAGTTTTNVAYNQTAFNLLATEPASRKNLVEAINTVSQPNLTPYAQLAAANVWAVAQAFTSGITMPLRSVGDNTSNGASTEFVTRAIGAIANTGLANRIAIVDERLAQGANAAGSAGSNTRQINTIHRNPAGDIVSVSAGAITLKAGTYLCFATAVGNRVNGHKLQLWDNTANGQLSTRSSSGYQGSFLNDSAAQNVQMNLFDVITLAAQTSISLRSIIETAGTDALGRAANRSGFGEMYSQIIFFRID